jgi:urea ABC transporter ATP-binding protein UrtE
MLKVENVHASYGTVPVLTGISLELPANEIIALLGRNGVGKTTLLKVLIGLLKPDEGQVDFEGQTISGLPPHRIARMGLAYVPQGRGIFPQLTVRENLQVGTRAAGGKSPAIPEEVFTFFPVLKNRLGQAGGTLSGGEQQMLAIGRALCGKPKLLLLDEPSEGIQPSIVQQLGSLIPEIAGRTRMSVLIVEQNIDLALHVARHCLVMEKGRIVYEGRPENFQDEAILREFLAI